MKEDDEPFRTFCHISEYGEAGYATMHRLVAASWPLVLWAPSSVLVSQPNCRLTPSQFVRLVENEKIRVIGRRTWLTNRDKRNEHPWSGARWVPEIDDALKSIATDDDSRPVAERRVAIAEDEKGDVWAKGYVERHSEVVETLYSAISAPDAVEQFPSGVAESALSAADPRSVVERIVQDAYNHDAAIAQSGTQVPFLLAPREARFHQLLDSVRSASDIEFPESRHSSELSPSALAEMTTEVRQVLEHLENAGATKTEAFLAGDGHRLLAEWMKHVYASLDRTGAHSVRGEMINRLREEFDAGRLDSNWRDVFLNRSSLVGLLGTAVGVADPLINQLSIFGALGLATSAYAIGEGLAQKLGLTAAPYDGPQWAFIYAFGRKASGRRRARLQQTLDLLTP